MRPGWDCAPPSPNLTELAQGCLDDPQCMSMPIKQGGGVPVQVHACTPYGARLGDWPSMQARNLQSSRPLAAFFDFQVAVALRLQALDRVPLVPLRPLPAA